MHLDRKTGDDAREDLEAYMENWDNARYDITPRQPGRSSAQGEVVDGGRTETVEKLLGGVFSTVAGHTLGSSKKVLVSSCS